MKNNISKILIVLVAVLFSLSLAKNTQAFISYGNGWDYSGYSQNNYYNDSNPNPNYVSIYPYQNAPTPTVTYVPTSYNVYPNSLNQNTNNQNLSNGQATPTVVNNYYYQNTTNKTDTSSSTTNKNISTNGDKSATKSNSSNSSNGKEVDMNNLPSVIKSDSSFSNNLPALSLGGKGTFMPSSVWQWILVVILILIIIIVARLLTHKKKEHHIAPAH